MPKRLHTISHLNTAGQSEPPELDFDFSLQVFDEQYNISRAEWFHVDEDDALNDDEDDDTMHPLTSDDPLVGIEGELDEDLSEEALEIEEEMRHLEEAFLEMYEADLAEAKLNSMSTSVWLTVNHLTVFILT